MVRVVDLEEEDLSDPIGSTCTLPETVHSNGRLHETNEIANILTCYPIAVQLASYLDLNTLHALSQTSHLIRSLLLLSRTQFHARALCCINDQRNPRELLGREYVRRSVDDAEDSIVGPSARLHEHIRTTTTGSFDLMSAFIMRREQPPCVRDLVASCRRCGLVVCRNCTTKISLSRDLVNRHRRLCQRCCVAPLHELCPILPFLLENPPKTTDVSGESKSQYNGSRHRLALQTLTVYICTCAEEIHLCEPCGRKAIASHIAYGNLLAWRSHYGAFTGDHSMEGYPSAAQDGVQCARAEDCLAGKELEVEVSTSDNNFTGHGYKPLVASRGNDSTNDTWLESLPTRLDSAPKPENDGQAGYHCQEIEGIGGVLRAKTTRRVRIGAPVDQETSQFEMPSRSMQLAIRETEGKGERRSWCQWCQRVVLSKEEKQAYRAVLEQSQQ